MGQLHQRHAAVEGQYARPPQLGEEPALPGRLATLPRMSVGHPGAAQHDTDHHEGHRGRVKIEAQPLEQQPEPYHREDETDAAPQPDLAVALSLLVQMRQGDDFELRQHRVPEERMQRHHQRQPGKALVEEDQPEGQQGAQRAETDDFQPATGCITQPAPEIRRHATHQHGNGDQLADPLRRETQVIEVQAEKRRRGAEQAKVEEVETGQTPVRQSSGHRLQATDCGQRPPYAAAVGLPSTARIHSCGSTGVSTCTSAFCPRWRRR